MNAMTIYDYCISYAPGQYEDVRKEQLLMEYNTSWQTNVISKTITLFHLLSPL